MSLLHFLNPFWGYLSSHGESCTTFCCSDCQIIKVTFLPFLLSEGAERKGNLLGLLLQNSANGALAYR